MYLNMGQKFKTYKVAKTLSCMKRIIMASISDIVPIMTTTIIFYIIKSHNLLIT